MRSLFGLCVPLVLPALVLAQQAWAEEPVLNLYSWADYVAPQTLQRFTEQTGIQVRYDIFDTSEVLETKLLTGRSGYDLVVPSSSVLARGLASGALQEIGLAGLKGYANLDPDLLAKLAVVDPGNRYGVPYTWGTLGLAVNVQALRQLQPSVRYVASGRQLNDLANGSLCLALTYNGDASMAADQARKAGKAFEVAYRIPRDGTLIWQDNLAIPKDAPHPEAARAFIEFMLRPESVAALSNTLFFANANQAATPLVDAAIRNDPNLYPGPDMRARLYADRSMSLKDMRQRTRIWTTFRSRQP